jgi:hypothetical protein
MNYALYPAKSGGRTLRKPRTRQVLNVARGSRLGRRARIGCEKGSQITNQTAKLQIKLQELMAKFGNCTLEFFWRLDVWNFEISAFGRGGTSVAPAHLRRRLSREGFGGAEGSVQLWGGDLARSTDLSVSHRLTLTVGHRAPQPFEGAESESEQPKAAHGNLHDEDCDADHGRS